MPRGDVATTLRLNPPGEAQLNKVQGEVGERASLRGLFELRAQFALKTPIGTLRQIAESQGLWPAQKGIRCVALSVSLSSDTYFQLTRRARLEGLPTTKAIASLLWVDTTTVSAVEELRRVRQELDRYRAWFGPLPTITGTPSNSATLPISTAPTA